MIDVSKDTTTLYAYDRDVFLFLGDDLTHLKAHRTAASLLKKGMLPVASGAPKAV